MVNVMIPPPPLDWISRGGYYHEPPEAAPIQRSTPFGKFKNPHIKRLGA